jgi:hypothetical protein
MAGIGMGYKALRKDLTETTRKCDFCESYLTSLKAFVLEDESTGSIAYAGPTCAKNKLGKGFTLSGIPDLTKFTLSDNIRDTNSGGGKGGRKSLDPVRLAIEYLTLREEKLKDVMKTSYSVLKGYYNVSKSRSLTEAEVLHINNIEAKSPDSLKLASLQRCYNYLFWIDVGINKLPSDKIDFLRSVREDLVNSGRITEAQKKAVNRWLSNIDGVPQLK